MEEIKQELKITQKLTKKNVYLNKQFSFDGTFAGILAIRN